MPSQASLKHPLWWLSIPFLLIIMLILSIGQPSYAQDETHTPTATFSVSRFEYFRPDLREPYYNDIALHNTAPLYKGDFRLTFTDDQAVVFGTLNVIYTNRSSDELDTIVFRLYPNLPAYGGEMTVHFAQVDAREVQPDLDESGSVLTVPVELPPGQEAEILLQFESRVHAGEIHLFAQYSYLNNALALPNVFPLLSVYDSVDGWWQNTAHVQGQGVYSEVAFFDITITAPAEWIFVTSGVSTASHLNGDSTRTTRFIASLMRDFGLLASPEYRTVSGTAQDVTIDVHYLPGGETAARTALQYAINAVNVFSAYFGPYPYTELDVAETFTTAGGIEYPGLVSIQSDSWNATERYLEILVVHEIAHQWWYGLVGNKQMEDVFLDEALAQYSLLLYTGVYSAGMSPSGVIDSYEEIWRDFSAPDLTLGQPAADYRRGALFPIIYNKGPLFFVELANQYGQDPLISALSTFYFEYRYGIATIESLQQSLSDSLDADLTEIFEEWVG